MGFEEPKSKQIDPISRYSKEVLKKMYPGEGKRGMKITDAIRQVLTNHCITDKADVSRLMREIGGHIKKHGDLKRWEKEARVEPIEPVKPSKQPHEDVFTRSNREMRERAKAASPLFADQIDEEMKEEERLRGF